MKETNINNGIIDSFIGNEGKELISENQAFTSLTNNPRAPVNIDSKVLLGITVERETQFKRLWFEVPDNDKDKRRFFDLYAETRHFIMLPLDWTDVLELVKENFNRHGFIRVAR